MKTLLLLFVLSLVTFAQSLSVSPQTATLAPGQTQRFTTNGTLPVWSTTFGTIDQTGQYTAPATQTCSQFAVIFCSATVRVVSAGRQATASLTLLYNVPIVQFQQYLNTWVGSNTINTVGTLTSGVLPTNLLSGVIGSQNLPAQFAYLDATSSIQTQLNSKINMTGAPGAWPSFAPVATSGNYNDLTNTPSIPTQVILPRLLRPPGKFKIALELRHLQAAQSRWIH